MKDDAVYVRHILDAIEKIEEYTTDVSRQEFHEESIVQDAVIRQLEIIGEATKRISSETRAEYEEVPWQDIADMRDKLIHGYFGTDVDIVWETIVDEVPVLKRQLDDFTPSDGS